MFLLLGCGGDAGPEDVDLPPVVGKWILDVPDSKRLAKQEIEQSVQDPRVAKALSRRLEVNYPDTTREAKLTFLEVRENGTFYWTRLDPNQGSRSGRWEFVDRGELVLKTRGARRKENELARLSLEQEKLVLKGSYGNDSSSFGLVLRRE